MKMKKFSATEQTVHTLVLPIAQELGFTIWDVSYEKEGAYWYLRIYADRPGGMDMEDCETLTRPVNAAIDAADPISGAYVLEVGSAGLERELNQPWHFDATMGMLVRARSVRPVDGMREWVGTLTGFDGQQIILETDTGEIQLDLAGLSYIKRYVAIEF